MEKYLHKWFLANRKEGWETYTLSSLRDALRPFYDENKTNNAPYTDAKVGRDLGKCPFIVRRRLAKGKVYDVNWDWTQ